VFIYTLPAWFSGRYH